jgi:hypothetical protein
MPHLKHKKADINQQVMAATIRPVQILDLKCKPKLYCHITLYLNKTFTFNKTREAECSALTRPFAIYPKLKTQHSISHRAIDDI